MRFLCSFLALGVGSVVLLPESAEACHRRGARASYAVAAPVYSSAAHGCCPTGYPGGYSGAYTSGGYAPGAYYGGYSGAYTSGGYVPGAYYGPSPYSYPPGYHPGAYPGHYYPPSTYPPGGLQPVPSPPITMPMPSGKTANVVALDDKYDPTTLTVAPGTTVRWVNKGEHKHTVTSATGSFDSGDIAPGKDYSYTFPKAGTFEYYCKYHKRMKGTIIVK